MGTQKRQRLPAAVNEPGYALISDGARTLRESLRGSPREIRRPDDHPNGRPSDHHPSRDGHNSYRIQTQSRAERRTGNIRSRAPNSHNTAPHSRKPAQAPHTPVALEPQLRAVLAREVQSQS